MALKKVERALHKHRKKLESKRNVIGTGIGRKVVKGKMTKQEVVVVFVKSKKRPEQIASKDLIPASVSNITTDVVELGDVKALQDPKGKFRPAPGGVSVGHKDITAGTLGLWVQKNNAWHILSNNHVLANVNAAAIGDSIYQPGSYDGGKESDTIAKLSEFITIDFNVGDNLVDAALAKVIGGEGGDDDPSACFLGNLFAKSANAAAFTLRRKTRLQAVIPFVVGDYVDEEILNIGKPSGFGSASVGDAIKKMGRTTGLTTGTVLYENANVNVNYSNGKIAYFTDQLVAGAMSAGGDSGSAILKENNELVGLLFAGSATSTIMNRIEHVQNLLNFTL